MQYLRRVRHCPAMGYLSPGSYDQWTKHVFTLVRFCVDYRIKPHVPPFDKVPANSVKFQPCDCTTQAGCLCVSLYMFNTHLLLCRLPGCQILIVIYTFAVQLASNLTNYLRLDRTCKLTAFYR